MPKAETSAGVIEFDVFDEEAWKRLLLREKDCRTCEHFWRNDSSPNDRGCALAVDEEMPCILGSRYERASFTPLWRTE